MPDSFGARLRQRREERQIDLIAIAEQTKIKLALLDALERDDVSQWPSGIFRRAYIRTYAQFIGLDPDVVVREFLQCHPDPGDVYDAFAAASAAIDETWKKNAPPTRLRTMVDSALGSLAKLRRNVPSGDAVPAAPAKPIVPDVTPIIEPAQTVEPPPAFEVAASAEIRAADDEPVQQRRAAVAFGADVAAARAIENVDLLETTAALEAEVVAAAERAVASEALSEAPAVETPAMDADADADLAAIVMDVVQPVDLAAVDTDVAEIPEEVTATVQLAEVHEVLLESVARVCTELGRASSRGEVQLLLRETARVVDAAGLIVWLWDETMHGLRPALVHGYSDTVLAHLPTVPREADNATAAAFRSANTCEVAAAAHTSAALVVPLLTPEGCAGVLAIEFLPGVEPARASRAVATLLAAALTQLVHRSRPAEQLESESWAVAALTRPRPPLRPAKVRR